MTTRGLKEQDFKEIGLIIASALKKTDTLENLKKRVLNLTSKYPVIGGDL